MSVVTKMLEEAIEAGREKVAQWSPPSSKQLKEKVASDQTLDWRKVASACGTMAEALGQETPTSRQKVAELVALYEKLATQDPVVMESNVSGTSLDAGESGSATDQPPMRVALQGSKLPDTENDCPGGSEAMVDKIAQAKIAWLSKLAQESVVPTPVASQLIKEAEDSRKSNLANAVVKGALTGPKGAIKGVLNAAMNKSAAEDSGAIITAGTQPIMTPYDLGEVCSPCNPKGHHLVSPESVAAASKGQLKEINAGVAPYLDQSVSQSNDSVLQSQLNHASSADIKLASVKTWLTKWASESSENQQKLTRAIKTAAAGNSALNQIATEHSEDISALISGEG